MFNCLIDPEITFYSHEVWFTLMGHVNGQYTTISHVVHEAPFCEDRLWCIISYGRMIQQFFLKIIHSKIYIRLVLHVNNSHLLQELKEKNPQEITII